MEMPTPDIAVMARRSEIVAALRAIIPGEGVISDPASLRPWESDGLTAYAQVPLVVALPENTAQVAAVLRWCNANGVKVVPRGSGTSLSGGALPLADGVLLGLSRLNQVLEIDYADRVAVVQPGVTNLAITRAVEERGFYYAPDPSSQIACSIGGNVAENSGGVHCLKYGLTTNNVLGVELVLIDGEIVRLGGRPAGNSARRAARRPQRGKRRAVRGRGDRRRHHPGRHGDDGPAGDPCGRSLCQRRLSARCRGAAHRRARWAFGGV
jgi:glycolate oxidase